MSNQFTFEYYDNKNEMKIKLIVDVTELAKREVGSKVQGMAIFKTDSEIWYKGKRYDPEEFRKFSYTDEFKMEFDFGFGGTFNFFCANILAHIQAMAAGNQSSQMIQ